MLEAKLKSLELDIQGVSNLLSEKFIYVELPILENSFSNLTSLISKANVGDVTSQLTLGKIWYQGTERSPVNFKKAIYWFSIAAEQGSAEAQFNLGIMYANGEGVRKDNKAALEWFTLAAEQGHSDAQKRRRIMNLNKNTPYPQYYPF